MTKVKCDWITCLYNADGKCHKEEISLKHVDNDNGKLSDDETEDLIQKLDCVDYEVTPPDYDYNELENIIPINDKEIPLE